MTAKSVTDRCAGILGKYTKSVIIKPTGDGSRYSIQNGVVECIGSHDRRVRPIPLKCNENYSFYFELNFKLINRNSVVIRGVSLQLFYNSLLLFRAEWGNLTNNNHPQPHWHFEQSTSRITESDADSFEELPELEKESFADELNKDRDSNNLSKMHFAMCSKWYESKGNCKSEISNDGKNFYHWLENCMDSIVEQIEYASSKKR